MVHDNPAQLSQCGAHYKVMRVAESHSVDRLLHCKVCKQPLAARDGEDILKYFLVGRPRRGRASLERPANPRDLQLLTGLGVIRGITSSFNKSIFSLGPS